MLTRAGTGKLQESGVSTSFAPFVRPSVQINSKSRVFQQPVKPCPFKTKFKLTHYALLTSAEADLVCPTSSLPALPCRAFTCRRFAAGVSFVPPSVGGNEFRNGLKMFCLVCGPWFAVRS